MLELPPLSLYIHIPWCIKKCPYCDFNSHTSDAIPEAQYITALINDLDQELEFVQGRELQSIFFGGGTPSIFSYEAIASILQQVQQRIAFSPTIEITLEANPGTVEQQKFIGYRLAGVNRLSIGVQSFNAQHLNALGRIHDNKESLQAARSAITAGFDNFNIDLMHGLPNQSQSQALTDIQQAIELKPSHISWYQLTIEPNTAFYNTPPTLPNDDRLADIQAAGEQLLASHHFLQYEISAYSQPQQQSIHNMNYWLFGDYIGIGAGAHGKLTELSSGAIHRRWKTRGPKDYLSADKHFLAGSKAIIEQDLAVEFMMNSLRLVNGFDSALFEIRTGCSLNTIATPLKDLFKRGLLIQRDNIIAPTVLGRRFLNDILASF